MGELFTYLEWRGDLSFGKDPFNKGDNLLLAELSYTDFEGVFTEDRIYSIQETAERYYELHTEEEVQARTTLIGHAPLLLKPMADAMRFRGLMLSDYVNVVDVEKEEQFSAVIYRIQDGREMPLTYVAFRGTDDNLVGWKEDFNLSYLKETPSQRRAVDYLEQHFGDSEEHFLVGGHSKGGNLAVYAAAFCSPAVRSRIDKIYSNDGPGFRGEILDTEGYRVILPRIRSYVPEMSVVGMLLDNTFSHRVVKSSQTGIMQHDALSWQVLGNRFVRVQERSEVSRFLDTALGAWIGGMQDSEKQEFVSQLFNLFDASGEYTLEGLQKNGFRSVNDIFRALRAMPPDQRKTFNRTLHRLLESGRETLMGDLKEELQQRMAAAQKARAERENGDNV